jgi:uncharacterized membrane protein YhaH (DUF805 family)
MNANSMTPIDWAKRPVTEKYADFRGRAPRAEYWWYILGAIIVSVIARIIDSIVGLNVVGPYGLLSLIVMLGLLVPNIAVSVRRLHDTNRSGWWILLPIVPYALAIVLAGPAIMTGSVGAGIGIAALLMFVGFICGIVVLVFMCLAGTPGDNRYGPNPYGGDGVAVAAE